MTLDLTEDEARALVAHLKHSIEYDPFPYAPRLDPLKAILAKPRPADTAGRALAAAEAWYGAKPRARKVETVKAGMTPSRRWLLAGVSRADEIGLGAALERIALFALCLAMMLAGCRGPNADAELGPNPGGGFQYGAEHGDNGSINPP